MEKRKPEKRPCPLCAKPLAPQGVALHYQRKHAGEPIPGPLAPASAPARTESAPASSSAAPAPTSSPRPRGGILAGEGGILE